MLNKKYSVFAVKAFFENTIYDDENFRIGINNVEHILGTGDFCIIGSSDIHYYKSQALHSSVIIVIFDPHFLAFVKLRAGFKAF